ncbi:MAG: tRNA threonylcarbamoyladenosine dehydratase [Bacteroides sp.]|nr:tRNA threonylcarbamoyladenosine dehydratase [Bacteroides sp.]
MEEWKQRTALLMGDEGVERLQRAHVLVAGVGGVGSWAAEMLCRAGVGRLTLVDADTVAASNINRQLPALHSTVGRPKVEVMARRLLDINPSLQLRAEALYLQEENIGPLLDECRPDFVVDAIDTLRPKCLLIAGALERRMGIVSSMGAGAKVDVSQVRLSNLWDTYHCALSRSVRRQLRQMGLGRCRLPVVFSTEQAAPQAVVCVEGERHKKSTCGTVSYLPAVFGCFLAEYVVRKLVTARPGIQ